MILCGECLFSGTQSSGAIAGQDMSSFTVTTNASTNYYTVNDGVEQQWLGKTVYWFAVVTEAITGTTSTVDFRLQTDDNTSFSSAATFDSTGAIAEATLVAGYRFFRPLPLTGCEEYLRVGYVVANNALSDGTVISGLTLDPTAWTSFANSYTV